MNMIATIRNHPWKCIFGGFFLILLLASVVEPPIDGSRVHAPLLALKSPFRSIKTSYYLDGGSVSVRIVDRDGVDLSYALPISTNKANPYPEIWFGAEHVSEKSAKPLRLEDPLETKKYLFRLVAQNPSLNEWDMWMLVIARSLPKDYAVAVLNKPSEAPQMMRYLIREKFFGANN